jgi:hypothetical protein
MGKTKSSALRKPFIKDYWKFTYSMLSNWGLIIISIIIYLILTWFLGLQLKGKLILPLMYLTLSIIFYFPIRQSKDSKIGYIVALILGELILLQILYY